MPPLSATDILYSKNTNPDCKRRQSLKVTSKSLCSCRALVICKMLVHLSTCLLWSGWLVLGVRADPSACDLVGEAWAAELFRICVDSSQPLALGEACWLVSTRFPSPHCRLHPAPPHVLFPPNLSLRQESFLSLVQNPWRHVEGCGLWSVYST